MQGEIFSMGRDGRKSSPTSIGEDGIFSSMGTEIYGEFPIDIPRESVQSWKVQKKLVVGISAYLPLSQLIPSYHIYSSNKVHMAQLRSLLDTLLRRVLFFQAVKIHLHRGMTHPPCQMVTVNCTIGIQYDTSLPLDCTLFSEYIQIAIFFIDISLSCIKYFSIQMISNKKF